MKAMILAAGRGERMRPLTDSCPKPLLKVHGITLIEHHINKLTAVGITELVINHAWLGEHITDYFKDGKDFGVNIRYSEEPFGALETAGGIIKALPLLGDEPFLIVNGDIYCDFDFTKLPHLADEQLAHLIMVNNPEHNSNGDFAFANNTPEKDRLTRASTQLKKYTYAGIGVYHPKLFKGLAVAKTALAPILINAMAKNQITGSLYEGLWSDIGTPERLAQINRQVMDQ